MTSPRPRATLASMSHSCFRCAKLILVLGILMTAMPGKAGKKNLPTVRWASRSPGCEFQRGEDGRYRGGMAGDDLDLTLLVDSQELSKGRRRFYHVLGVYLSVTYTGQGRFEFPADLRMNFVRHHEIRV